MRSFKGLLERINLCKDKFSPAGGNFDKLANIILVNKANYCMQQIFTALQSVFKQSKRLQWVSWAVVCSVSVSGCSMTEKSSKETVDTSSVVVEKLLPENVQQGGFTGAAEAVARDRYGDEYRLSIWVNDTIHSLDNGVLHSQSQSLCANGYVKLSQQAFKRGRLKETSLACVNGDCEYQLKWHIRCQAVPKQPFSLFGKS